MHVTLVVLWNLECVLEMALVWRSCKAAGGDTSWESHLKTFIFFFTLRLLSHGLCLFYRYSFKSSSAGLRHFNTFPPSAAQTDWRATNLRNFCTNKKRGSFLPCFSVINSPLICHRIIHSYARVLFSHSTISNGLTNLSPYHSLLCPSSLQSLNNIKWAH